MRWPRLRAGQERLRAVAFDDLARAVRRGRAESGRSPAIRWPISSAAIAWGSCPSGCGGPIFRRLPGARFAAGRRPWTVSCRWARTIR